MTDNETVARHNFVVRLRTAAAIMRDLPREEVEEMKGDVHTKVMVLDDFAQALARDLDRAASLIELAVPHVG